MFSKQRTLTDGRIGGRALSSLYSMSFQHRAFISSDGNVISISINIYIYTCIRDIYIYGTDMVAKRENSVIDLWLIQWGPAPMNRKRRAAAELEIIIS